MNNYEIIRYKAEKVGGDRYNVELELVLKDDITKSSIINFDDLTESNYMAIIDMFDKIGFIHWNNYKKECI